MKGSESDTRGDAEMQVGKGESDELRRKRFKAQRGWPRIICEHVCSCHHTHRRVPSPSVGESQGCRDSADGVYKGLGLRETRQTPHLASPASQMSEVDGDGACGCLVLPTFLLAFGRSLP